MRRQRKAKIPVYVDEWSHLQAIDRSCTGYLGRKAGPLFLRWVGTHGGEVWGGPGSIIGGRSGPVWAVPAGSVSNGPVNSQRQLDHALGGLRQWCSDPRVWTAGSASLKFIAHMEGEHWVGPLELGPKEIAVLRDSVHAGPCEWRRKVYNEPLIYIDQRNAYLQSMERGVPDWQWRSHGPDDWESYVMHWDDPFCTVSDVTLDVPAELAPRKTSMIGPVVYETGVQRLVLRGPLLRLALYHGATVVEYHGGMHSKRHFWRHALRQWRKLLEPEAPPNAGIAAKAMYTRLWGKYGAEDRLNGKVYPQPMEDSADKRQTVEMDDQGRKWFVVWEQQDPVGPYRPDIAGEVVAQCHARTLDLAYRLEKAGLPVALTHVDAVCVVGESAARLYDESRWAIKAKGIGSVLGHGRYYIDDPDRGPVMGRMGMGVDEAWTWTDPSDPSQRAFSLRDWTGWTSAPRNGTGARSYQSAPYPWAT